jgi:hypothetical protein
MRLALPLVLASQLTAPSAVPAAKTGTLIGRVLPPSDDRPIAKAIWIDGVATPVGPDGRFRTAVPEGPAEIVVETAAGLYVVPSPVTVAPGAVSSVQLALRAGEDTSAPAPAEKDKKKKPASVWTNPTYATLIIIGAAVVVGVAVDQLVKPDEVEASPFVPSASTHP